MRNNGLIFIGILLVSAGVLFLVGNVLDINVWAFCFPAALILGGIFLILRPRLAGPDTESEATFIGDMDYAGKGPLQNKEYYSFIGDIDLDLTQADIPPGETVIKSYGFIGDIDVIVPADIGLAVESTAFVSEFKVPGHSSEDYIFSPASWQSEDYKSAERRVRLLITYFIVETKIRQLQ